MDTLEHEADSTLETEQAGEEPEKPDEGTPLQAAIKAAMDEAEQQSEPEEEAPDGEAESEADQAEAEPEPSEESESSVTIPEDFPQEHRDALGRLPDDGKQVVLDIQRNLVAGFTRKSQELSEKARFADAIEQEIRPFEGNLKAQGQDAGTFVRNLIGWAAFYNRDKEGFLRQIASEAGVSLGEQQQAPDTYTDPALATLQQQNSELTERLDRFEQGQVQHRRSEAEQVLKDFTDATDANGALVHPHLEQVKPIMGALMQTGLDMEESYQRAVRADPELYKQTVETARAAALEADRKEREEAAKKAQAAKGVSTRKQPSTAARSKSDLHSIVGDAIKGSSLFQQ